MSPITRPPPLPSMFRPSMAASATTVEAKTDTHDTPATAIAATTAATTKKRAGTVASTTATGRRAPSLIPGSAKAAPGEPAQLRLMPAQAQDHHIAPSVEERHPGGSASPPSPAARTATTLGLTSRADDEVERSCSAAGPVAVESTSVTATATTAATTAAASAAAVSAASEAGRLLAPFPATTIMSAAVTVARSTRAVIPSVERRDSSPRDSKRTTQGAAAANDGDRGAGGGGMKPEEVPSTTKGEIRAGGGSSRQVGGSGRSSSPTGTVVVVATAAATAMAASTSANAPKEDNSAEKESLLPSTNNSREHNSGHGAGEEVVVGVAPAGSLVRLKKRRQQARTRANNQR